MPLWPPHLWPQAPLPHPPSSIPASASLSPSPSLPPSASAPPAPPPCLLVLNFLNACQLLKPSRGPAQSLPPAVALPGPWGHLLSSAPSRAHDHWTGRHRSSDGLTGHVACAGFLPASASWPPAGRGLWAASPCLLLALRCRKGTGPSALTPQPHGLPASKQVIRFHRIQVSSEEQARAWNLGEGGSCQPAGRKPWAGCW